MLNANKTSAQLRLLAKAIEEGDNVPDFFFCVINVGEHYCSTHRAEEDVFGLMGLVWQNQY